MNRQFNLMRKPSTWRIKDSITKAFGSLLACCCVSGLAAPRSGTVAALGMLPPPITNAIAVSVKSGVAGGPNALALLDDGRVVQWGNSGFGLPAVPADLTNAIAISAGPAHCLAVRYDGTVVCWGRGSTEINAPPAGLSNVVAVAAGWDKNAAILKDGTVRGWGNYEPAYGLGGGAVAISTGVDHFLALTRYGTVVAWAGVNQWGQASPPAGLTNVVGISPGWMHSLALKSDGTVVAWGNTNVTFVPDSLTNATAVAAAHFENYALLSDGSILHWGPGFTRRPFGPEHTNFLAVASSGDLTVAITLQPAIMDNPLDQRLSAGETASFAVSAVSGSPLRYQWRFNGVDLAQATNNTLVISNLQARHVGAYRALVSNDKGVTFSAEADLEVLPSPPRLTKNLSPASVLAGSELVLEVAALGSEPIHYQWSRRDGPILAATNSILRFENIQETHEARYLVTVTNAHGAINSAEVLVTVNYPPAVTNTLSELVVPAGTNLILRAFAEGNPPIYYQWQFNGVPLEGTTNVSLVLPNVQTATTGDYSIIASNAFGIVTNTVYRITTIESPPLIYAAPVSQKFQVGDSIALKVRAGGTAPLTFQWSRNGGLIPGATNPLLTLNNLQSSDGGEYFVAITNHLGSTNSGPATLSLGERFPGEVDWPLLRLEQQLETNRFSFVTGITPAPDGRLYILEQGGRIHALSNQTVSRDFLNLATNVLTGAERGLLGIAFSPGFLTNRTFYLNYTRRPDGATVISRFKATSDGNSGDAASEEILKVIPQPAANHNGGQMVFGPDGYLYIGMGDGGQGASQNAQDPSSLLGKILRIDVESGVTPYGIPPTNPFITNSAYQPEIWALGLRNPWRFSFDRATGDLFIADVGERRFEEVNFQPGGFAGGANYGWPQFEGDVRWDFSNNTNSATFQAPVITYPHQEGLSITGGYVYRGSEHHRMNGIYFFGDFLSGRVWGLKSSGTNGTNWTRAEVLRAPFRISTFGEGLDGALYLAEYAPQGRIFRLADSRQAATPSFSAIPGTIFTDQILVGSSTPGVRIHYTTDGRDPTEFDPSVPSMSSVTIVTGQVKTRAFRDDLEPSEIATANYALKVGPPNYSIAPRPVLRGTTISITTPTPQAVIHYTLDGSAPSRLAPIYSGPLVITNDVFLRAQAFRGGFFDSDPVQGAYSIAFAKIPQFNPLLPTITNGTAIQITTATEGAVIYYTTNGTDPDLTSLRYEAPVTLNGKTTLKAIVYHPNYQPSPIASHFYDLVYVETPQFTPAEGPITNNTEIRITTATPGATIRYTLDGSEPNETSPIYTAPFRIDGNTTVSASAFKEEHNPSAIQSTRFGLLRHESTVVWTLAGGSEPGATNGPGHLARFKHPHSLWRDPRSGALYVADSGNHMIRKIFPSGEVSTVAGTGSPGYVEGSVSVAQFNLPIGITGDHAGNLFVTDRENGHRVRVVTTTGQVGTWSILLGPEWGAALYQIEMDSTGNFYVGTYSFVTKIAARTRALTHIAGSFQSGEFFGWTAPIGIGIGPDDSVFATAAHRIVRVAPAAEPVLIAGSTAGIADGSGTNALFNLPNDIAADRHGNLYVSESTRIRKITPTGEVSTLAGNGQAGFRDGPGSQASFNAAAGLTVDTNGNIYVADSLNHRIRVVSPDTDADAIPDFKETAPFALGVNDRTIDSDNDGISNASEYLAGTDPSDSASAFRIEEVRLNNGRAELKWHTVPYRYYRIERSEDLRSWSTMKTGIQGTGSSLTYSDQVPAADSSSRAYRIVVEN